MADPVHGVGGPGTDFHPEPGCLYIAATPIGNLGDISPRIMAAMQQVDLLLCEDTRTTGRLVPSNDRAGQMMSYHDHNEMARIPQIMRMLKEGKSACLVSDAGTPLISDPGYRIVRAARQEGIKVIPLPGPSAMITALSVSGLPTDRFCFAGFVPRKKGARARLWQEIQEHGATTVVYIPARSLIRALHELADTNDPEVCVMREATKMHEEYLFGHASRVYEQLDSRDSLKGEVTLVIGAAQQK